MKKVAVTVAVLALGLAACEARTDENAMDNEVAVENEAANDTNMATEDAGAAAENALENAAEDVGNVAENLGEAAENATE
jgi:hypothetical protein